MVFNSLHFLVFFGWMTGAYFVLGHRWRPYLLLLGSCYFYMAFMPIYILILGFTILVDYWAARWIDQAQGHQRKALLILSILANVGVLAYFKYYAFIGQNLTWLVQALGGQLTWPPLSILLPIGLSFHTFQAMSYTIEVYRGKQAPERNFWMYSLYVMYFPQLVAGPIERPQNLLPQFHSTHAWDANRVRAGLLQMLWGFFKKVLIADRLAVLVDHVYGDLSHQDGFTIGMATLLYSFQIYGDFSGYSDIAIGASKVMGIELMRNFNAPYLAKSIPDFWRRWHISLSTWFKDYVYLSLGGNRVALPRWYFNILVVFVLSGIWHGASWNFVIWGCLHGLFQILGLSLSRLFPSLNPANLVSVWKIRLYQVWTFVLVSLAWVFFRLTHLWEIKAYLKALVRLPGQGSFGLNPEELCFALGLVGLLLWTEIKSLDQAWLRPKGFVWKCGLAIGLLYFFGVFDLKTFIYFQF